MPLKKKIALLLVILVSAVAYFFLGYVTDRSNFAAVIGLYGLVFLGYLYLIRFPLSLKQGILFALFFRLLFIGATPRLSDDYFRFIWDGTLLTNGENPYQHQPNYYQQPQNLELVPALTEDLYNNLNSPDYYSLYPPVCQAVFGLANLVGGSNLWLNCLIMRLFILLAEAGSFFFMFRLLQSLKLPPGQMWWYAFNPLIIIELTGNLHPEGLLIFFLLGSIYFLFENKILFSGSFMALAVGVKLWPLMFLPLVLNKLGFKKFLFYVSFLLGVTISMFFPFISIALLSNILNSVNLYFRQFEFNASIYYLVRWLGFRGWGYNLIAFIGPVLSLVSVAFILFLAFRKKNVSDRLFLQTLLFSFTVYLALATVVHPWYIASLVALGALTRWRFPIIWSGSVYLSYATYQTRTYSENLYLVAFEYIIVIGFLAYEWWVNKKSIPDSVRYSNSLNP